MHRTGASRQRQHTGSRLGGVEALDADRAGDLAGPLDGEPQRRPGYRGVQRGVTSAIGRKLDVSNSQACDDFVNAVREQFGRLDILVNNAGINRDAMLHKMTDDQWQQVINVDLSGVFFMTRAASRILRVAGAGRIVNIASASWMGNIGQANYSAAKAGVVGLSRTAAKELARYQVTVNAICPGFIDTQMTRGIPDQIREQQVAKIPLGRAGQPADVAALVAFLASNEAGYITGEVINVGGGYVL